MAFRSHEEYLATLAPEIRGKLEPVQAVVEAGLVDAVRCIGYNMPAYRLGSRGKIFFYFAAFKQHLGVYPPLKHDDALLAELAPWRNEKGNLRFPYKQAIPYELIGRVAVGLAREYR